MAIGEAVGEIILTDGVASAIKRSARPSTKILTPGLMGAPVRPRGRAE